MKLSSYNLKTLVMKTLLNLLLIVAATVSFNNNTHAQVTKTLNGTVRYESGMSTTTFETPNGQVIMKLPQSLSGSTISGTVITEPSGKTEKEKNKNAKELMKLFVMLNGQKIPLSAGASGFNWSTQPGRNTRTMVSLVNTSGTTIGTSSLPAVLPSTTTNTSNASCISTPSKVLLKGDALNVYTNNQFNGTEKFMLTDSKGQQFSISPLTLSVQQAVINVPATASTGKCTVSVQATSQPSSNTSFNLIDINLSSPNTDLRSGQQSSVTASITGLTSTSVQGVYIDLQNLDPKTVTMAGGNQQRIYMNGSAITRNITGLTAGSFSVTASLHEDLTTSNDPYRVQLNDIKTIEEYNGWTSTIKTNLEKTGTTNAQRAINNMPVCTNAEQLDECKAVAYSLVQPLLYEVKPFASPTKTDVPDSLKTSVITKITGNTTGGTGTATTDVPEWVPAPGIDVTTGTIVGAEPMWHYCFIPKDIARIFELIDSIHTWVWISMNLSDLTWTASNVDLSAFSTLTPANMSESCFPVQVNSPLQRKSAELYMPIDALVENKPRPIIFIFPITEEKKPNIPNIGIIIPMGGSTLSEQTVGDNNIDSTKKGLLEQFKKAIDEFNEREYPCHTNNGGCAPPCFPCPAAPSNENSSSSIFDQIMAIMNGPHDNTNPSQWTWMKWDISGWAGNDARMTIVVPFGLIPPAYPDGIRIGQNLDPAANDVDSLKITVHTPAKTTIVLPVDQIPSAYPDGIRIGQTFDPAPTPEKKEKKSDDKTRGLNDPIKVKGDSTPVPVTPYDKMTEKEKEEIRDRFKKVFDKFLEDAMKAHSQSNGR